MQDSSVNLDTPIIEEGKGEDSTKQEENPGTMKLRRKVHPPQRLTYDMLGESSEEPVFTVRRSDPEATLPTVNWVESESTLISDTAGRDLAIALLLSEVGYEITPEVCRLISES